MKNWLKIFLILLAPLVTFSQSLTLRFHVERIPINCELIPSIGEEYITLVLEGKPQTKTFLTEKLGTISEYDTFALVLQKQTKEWLVYKEEFGEQEYYINGVRSKWGFILFIVPIQPYRRENLYSLTLESL